MITSSRTSHLRLLLALGVLLAAPLACNDSTGNDEPEEPAEVQLLSGDDQQAAAGSELANPVVVRVLDSGGDPIRGQLVNFHVASGGGSVVPSSVMTTANGEAQARWTLGTSTAAPQRLEARAVDQESGPAIVFATFEATVLPGAPQRVEAVTGAPVEGTAGQALATPIVIAVFDQYGNPVPGVTVSWASPGAGSVAPASATTDAAGRASATWTLGTQAGAQVATATVAGLPPVSFTVAARAGAPASLEIVSGNNQAGVVASPLAEPLVVRVLDALGNPAPGATVRWEGSGQFDPHLTTTNAAGHASTAWRIGAVAGAQSATARVDGTSTPVVTFTANGTPGVGSILDIVSGDGQSGPVGQPLSQPFVVLVRDSWLNPVPGATVSFSIVSGGGTLNPAQPAASASGHASASLTSGTVAGPVVVRAQLSTGFSVEFTATALAGPFSQLIALSSLDQEVRLPSTSAVGQVRAADQHGNGIAGIQVSWTVLTGSGTVSSPTVSITGGLAQTAWALGPQPVQTMRASSGAVVSPVFTARVVDAAAWSRVTLPVTPPLRDIWGTSANNIYAVGDGGAVVHFNGAGWQRIDVGTTADLTEVLGTGPNDIRVAGSGQRIHFNGTTWNPVTWPTLPSPGRLKEFRGPAFARVAADDAMAIIEGINYGGRDTIKHWNGTAWVAELVVTDTEGAYAIWMAPDGRALVGMSRVGGSGSGYHYDGTAWRTGLGGGRVTGGYVGKSFGDVFIRMNSLGGCCSFAHSNGTTWDYNPGGSFGGVPLWFVSPDEVYYRDGTEVRRLRSGDAQSNGSGTAEGVNGTVMWGTSSTNLHLIATDGSLWRKSPP